MRTRRHPTAGASLLFLTGLAFSLSTSQRIEAAPALDELIAAIRQHREAFHAQTSYKFVFQVDSEVFRGQQTWVYRTFTVTDVRRGSDLSTSVFFPKGTLYGQEDRDAYTLRRVWYQEAGVDTNTKTLFEFTPRPLVQHYHFHQYTDYQHINTYADVPEPAGNLSPYEITQPFLPETIEESRSEYRVRPKPEDVEGKPCWVIERPGIDLVWIDDEGLIRQRQLHWGPGEPRSVITVLSDYEQMAPGLSLPKTISVQQFTNPRLDPEEIWDELSYTLAITLKEYEFNSAKDEDFIVEPKVGALVNDYIRRVQYRVPSPGEEPFERALEIAALEETGPTRLIILVNGLLLGILLVYILWRRIRAAQRLKSE